MGILDSLAQLEVERRRGATIGSQNIGNMLSRQNAIALGKKFAQRGDFTENGVISFMSENNVGEQGMQTILKLVQTVAEARGPAGVKVGNSLVNPRTGKPMFTAPQEPFTLSAGAKRYGGNNQQIATNPKLVAPQQADPYTLSPGAVRFGGDNQQIATNPKLPGTGKPSALSEKLALINEIPGMTPDRAKKLATGTLKTQKDPVTNEITIVDLANGTVERPSIADQELYEPIAVDTQTIWDLSGKATGPVSSALAGGSVLTGMVGLPIAKETVQARQYLRAAQNDLIRSLSINARFPVAEMNRIKNEINIEPRILDNPESLRSRMIAIDGYLKNRLSKELSVASDNRMPSGQRQAAIQASNDIQQFLKMLGVPDDQNMAQESGITDEQQSLIDKWSR